MMLDKRDEKILVTLFHNVRMPVTKIASTTGLTRQQVRYRLAKLEASGFIKKYLTVFNYRALGRKYLCILLLEQISAETKKRIANASACVSYGSLYGKYVFYANMVFEDRRECLQFTKTIPKLTVVQPMIAELYPLKEFNKNLHEPYLISGSGELKDIDNVDKSILKMLEEDGRARIVDIANATGISAELALQRIRRLQQRQIILGSKLLLDMQALGYHYTQIWFSAKLNEPTVEKLRRYCSGNERITTLVVGSRNFIQVFHQTHEELQETVRQFTMQFGFPVEITLAEQEERVNTLPFL